MSRIVNLELYILYTKNKMSDQEILESLTNYGWEKLKRKTSWIKRIFSPTYSLIFREMDNDIARNQSHRIHLLATALLHENSQVLTVPSWGKIRHSKQDDWCRYREVIPDISQHLELVDEFQLLKLTQKHILSR